MKKEEKKFVTEYQINGKKYAGEIWATSWEEAESFIKQRASTEKVVGFIPKDYSSISHPFLIAFFLQSFLFA